jgi:hypothetical protein
VAVPIVLMQVALVRYSESVNPSIGATDEAWVYPILGNRRDAP